jgi:tetratricopeptide (TPR) repeat protein
MALALGVGLGGPLWAQSPAPATEAVPAPGAAQPSARDAPLFYQLLIGEMELRGGEPGTAFQLLLDAARRTRDPALFRRSVEIALQARAGAQALEATRAWRVALPLDLEAMRFEAQLLVALNRPAEAVTPLRALLSASSGDERGGLIASLPGLLLRGGNRQEAATLVQDLLGPYLDTPPTAAAARTALARVWLGAGDSNRALEEATKAQAADPAAPGPALVAMDLLPGLPAAEAVVQRYLNQPEAQEAVRLAYVRTLVNAQRHGEAAAQLERLTRSTPDRPGPWLSLGALQVELKQGQAAQQSLQRYLQLVEAAPDSEELRAERTQAWLLMAQAAEQRGDLAGAEAWLSRIGDPQQALTVQLRRAMLKAREGDLRAARAMVRQVPERNDDDARAKLLAEAQVLREVKRWRDAAEVLAAANKRFPDNPDLLYEQAMMEEKLQRNEAMERLLKRVIELKPDHQHAYNALGYSLADRNQRLPEAKALIEKALSMAPGDPFITDSLGWVEFRLGNRREALRLLRQAYTARPDVEIAAHLGEVLWVEGQADEARRVLRDARTKEPDNEVLREAVRRLKIDL